MTGDVRTFDWALAWTGLLLSVSFVLFLTIRV